STRTATRGTAADRRAQFPFPRTAAAVISVTLGRPVRGVGMPPSAVLVVEDLVIRYGRRRAVDGVSFSVGRGELFGLLGSNGSGKSSTLFAVAGHLEPAGGRILLDGIGRRDGPREFAR